MNFLIGVLKVLLYIGIGDTGIYAFVSENTKFAKYQMLSAAITIIGLFVFPPIGVIFLIVCEIFHIIGIFTVLIPSLK